VSAVLEVQEPSARYLGAEQPALVRQFGLLAAAPGGVARLRELILTLAVQGKLVPQDPSDAPAGALLVRIREKRKQLVVEGKIKASKSEAPFAHQDFPFVVPAGWEWICAADACVVITDGDHQAPPKADSGVPFLVIGDVRDGAVGLGSATRFVTREYFDALDWGKKPLQGDILYTTVGSLGIPVPIVQQQAFCFQRHIALLRPGLPELQAFLTLALQSSLAFDQAERGATGIAQKTVPLSVLRGLRLPLPPLAEQARIVARVDELMRLCDALEAKGRLEAEQHARLLGTLLGTLTVSSTPEELAANWQRVADHFDLLLDRPEAVDALEQTIMQLAVRGLLVQQDHNDEPATVLIERIQAARAAQLANSSSRKARADLPEVDEDEWPFEPPPGWVWTRFGEVTHVSGGVTLGRKGAIASPLSLPYLRVANVQRWKLVLDSIKDVVIDSSELPRYQLADGDLLITEGGDWDKVGRTAIWRSELPLCLHQNHVFKARGYTTSWNPSWAELYLNLDVARAYFAASAKQTTNLASINMTELRHCVFPLPPLNEQARIVTRVTELRRLCANLRQRLTARQTSQSHLAEALVAEVA
jgi:type I restriction enzyme, S subunit